MTAHRVRPLLATDWPVLWPMLHEMGSDDDETTTCARFDSLLATDDWGLFAVESDGELVGYAAAQDFGPHLRGGDHHRVARLHDMFVLTDHRRLGAGRALMDAVVEWASNRVKYLEWQAHEERAAPFYRRLGYVGEPCPQPDYPTFEVSF